MAHMIDETTGKAAMAYTGEVPWHGLGFKLEANATIEEWTKAAGMEWTAEKADVMGKPETGSPIMFPGRHVLYRSDTRAPLWLVSSDYKAVQPKEVLEFFRDLVSDLGGFKMETAGVINGGRKVWALAKAAKDRVTFGKDDKVNRYLLLATSYDKSLPTIIQQTATRVVCNNTLTASVNAEYEPRVTVRHTTKFDAGKVKLKLALDDQWDAFGITVEKLTAKHVSTKAAEAFFADVLYTTEDRSAKGYNKDTEVKEVAQLMDVYANAPGQQMATANGTAWGLVNAVTYQVDHLAKTRTQDARLNKAWFGPGNLLKTRALQRAAVFAGA